MTWERCESKLIGHMHTSSMPASKSNNVMDSELELLLYSGKCFIALYSSIKTNIPIIKYAAVYM